MTACADLIAAALGPEPYRASPQDLLPSQLEAVTEALSEYRGAIPVLDQRASVAGVSRIASLDDLIALLFSHATYKSYPAALVRNRNWSRMNQWVSSLSRYPVGKEWGRDAQDVDEWLAELDAAGHHIISTSGTTGKCSFLPASPRDGETFRRMTAAAREWSVGHAIGKRPAFLVGPRCGRGRFVEGYRAIAAAFGRAEKSFYLSERPVSVAEINRLGELRQAMASGHARPAEIRSAEERARARQAETRKEFEALAARLTEYREEPIVVNGGGAGLYELVSVSRELGIPDAGFHPATVVIAGGGKKGTNLPPDCREQIRAFFGVERLISSYGMSEWNASWPQCAAGRYHCPPTTIPLVLDLGNQESLAPEEDGVVVGRLAFLDLLVDARWGGLVTGDRVTGHLTPCPCGRGASFTISDVERMVTSDDDKLTCAGTVEGYLRGALAASAADSSVPPP
jgi:hypothetical protein